MPKKHIPKRVLSICDISPSRFGSFEEFIVELTKKLNGDAFEHIIVFREKPIKSVEETLLNLGVRIVIIKPSRYSLYNFIKFYRLFKKCHPSIVHFHFYPIYTVVNYLKFVFDIKIFYTDHMVGRKTKSPFKKLLRMVYYYTHSKLFDCGIDKIVCVSNFVKSNYSKEYGINSKKLCVIYNGININRFQKKLNTTKLKYNINDEFVIICVGLRKEKGAHCLIKAAPIIIKQIPKIKFIFVGEGECRSYLETQVDKFHLKDYVIFAGNVSDIEYFYSLSSCVVIPTLGEEAFCFVAAEAMATETPVVAFDSGAIKEVMYCPEQVIERDYKMLSEKIIECLKNNNDLRQKKGREHVLKNFTLDKCAESYLMLYKKLNSDIIENTPLYLFVLLCAPE